MNYKLKIKKLPTSIVSFVFFLLISAYLLSGGAGPGFAGLTTASPVFAEELPNPLKTKSIAEIIGRVIRGAFGLAGSLALIIFIWGGFLWVTARGDEKQVKSGWDTVTWGALGIIVIFGSYMIAEQLLKIFGIK